MEVGMITNSDQRSPVDPASQNLAERDAHGSPVPRQPATVDSASSATTPSPLELLVQGIPQSIVIPPSTILSTVAKKMPAKKGLVYKCTRLGPTSFQASIELDVSGSRLTVEPCVKVARVIGDISPTCQTAEDSAVNKTFEYLQKKHFVHVTDYSSKVAEEYEDKPTFGSINSVLLVTDKVLDEWSRVLGCIAQFTTQLDRNETRETLHGVRSAAGDIYAESKNFIRTMLSRYTDKHRAIYLQYKEYEAQRSKYLRDSKVKMQNDPSKGYRQIVDYSEKDVLDYVLQHLGLPVPEYTNEPGSGGFFRGEVILNLPHPEEVRWGGRTKFHSANLLTAISAEEDAAKNALDFLESHLKISIVDINYADRVESKKNHAFILILLKNSLALAATIQQEWSNMIEYMDAGVDIYAGDLQGHNASLLSQYEKVAMMFCAEGMQKARGECVQAYEVAAVKLKALEKYMTNDSDDDI